MSADYLFVRADLGSVLRAHGEKLDRAAAALEPADVADERLDATVAGLVAEYTVEALSVDESAITTTTQEIDVDVSRDPNRWVTDRTRPYMTKGARVTFFVPFRGEPGLWNCRPSTSTSNPPRGEVSGQELLLQYEGVGLQATEVKARMERELKDIRRYLDWLAVDIAAFNSTVRPRSEGQVAARRAKVDSDRGLADGLGFPRRVETRVGRAPSRAATAPAINPERHPASKAAEVSALPDSESHAASTARPLQELARAGEGPTVEFKSSLRWDIREGRVNRSLQDEVLQAVAAFLNAQGGVVLLGVADDGAVLGLERDFATFRRGGSAKDQLLQTLANLVADNLGPAFTHLVHAELEAVGETVVCRVTVDRAPSAAYIDSDLFVRVGNTSRKLTPRDAVEYVRTHWR